MKPQLPDWLTPKAIAIHVPSQTLFFPHKPLAHRGSGRVVIHTAPENGIPYPVSECTLVKLTHLSETPRLIFIDGKVAFILCHGNYVKFSAGSYTHFIELPQASVSHIESHQAAESLADFFNGTVVEEVD